MLRLALEQAGFRQTTPGRPAVQHRRIRSDQPEPLQVSSNTVGKVANYLIRGVPYDAAHIDTARRIAMTALRESMLECSDSCTKDQRISNAIRHIRRNMLRINPQDDLHRRRLARELIEYWHTAKPAAQ